METIDPHPLIEFLVMCDDHSTFAGCEILGGIETVADRIAVVTAFRMASANRASFILRTCRMSSVLDNVQSLLACEPPDSVHVAWKPTDMDGYDCAGSWCQPR